uniref:hypothetical protein n=1 Tax=Planococcus sp. CAU13 TaxID=1541197 RepID=UPI001F36E245
PEELAAGVWTPDAKRNHNTHNTSNTLRFSFESAVSPSADSVLDRKKHIGGIQHEEVLEIWF